MQNLIKVDEFDNISFIADGGYGLVFRVNSDDSPSQAIKVLRNEKWEWAFHSFWEEFMVMQNFAGKHVLQNHKFVENGKGVTDGG